MLHPKRIVGWLVIIAAAGWCLYEWIFDGGLAYFAADWSRAALVAALSVVGGLIVFAIMRLPEEVRRKLVRLVSGGGVVFTVAGSVYCVWQLFQVRKFLADAPLLWLVTVGELAMLSLVGGMCIRFWFQYRRKGDHSHTG